MTPFLYTVAEQWLHYVWAMLWQSSLVMPAIWALYLVCRKRSAALRYGLLCLVLLKFLLPTSLHSVTGAGHWTGWVVERFEKAPEFATERASAELQTSGEIAGLDRAPSAMAPVLPDISAPAPVTKTRSPIHWPFVLFATWLAVAGLLGLALVAHTLRIRRRFAGAKEITDPGIETLLESCRAALGIRRRVRLCTLPHLSSPLLLGMWRPKIVVSDENIAQLNREQLRPVIIHELAHLKRHDLWVNAFQIALQVLWFFHPGLWITNWLIRREREKVCDDIVLVRTNLQGRAYADSMLAVLKASAGSPFPTLGLVGIAERGSGLRTRLARILDDRRRISIRISLAGAIALLAIGAVLLPMAKGAKRIEPTTVETNASVTEALPSTNSLPPRAESPKAASNAVATVSMSNPGTTNKFVARLLPLEVTVVNEEGTPVEGARVKPHGLVWSSSSSAWPQSIAGPMEVMTDAKGKAVIQYPEYVFEKTQTEKVYLEIDHPDYALAPVNSLPPISVYGISPPVVLRRGARVVVSGYIGNKSNVVSEVYPFMGYSTFIPKNTWHEMSHGIKECERMPPGSHYMMLVQLSKEGPSHFSAPVKFVADSGKTNEFCLEMKPGRSVKGMLDKSLARPIRNGQVFVHVYPIEPPVMDTSKIIRTAEESAAWQAKVAQDQATRRFDWGDWTDIQPDGSFEFTSLPRGRMELVAICDGAISQSPADEKESARRIDSSYGRPQVFMSRDEAEQITLAMEPTVTFEAKVVNEEGQPVQNAMFYFVPNVEWGKWARGLLGAESRATNVLNMESAFDSRLNWKWPRHDFRAMTDTNGIAIVTNLPSWVGSCVISHESYELPEHSVNGGTPWRYISVNLKAGGLIKMTIPVQKKEPASVVDLTDDTGLSSNTVAKVEGNNGKTLKMSAAVDESRLLPLEVMVINEEGIPVQGARVKPWGLKWGGSSSGWPGSIARPMELMTDAKGKAVIQYPEYAYENQKTDKVYLEIAHPDYPLAQWNSLPSVSVDGTSPPVVLQRGTRVVVSGYIGNKSNVVSEVYPFLGLSTFIPKSAWHEMGRGVKEYDRVPPGPHYMMLVQLSKEGPTSFSDPVDFVAETNKTYPFCLEMKPGQSVKGRLDTSLARPIRNGEVFVHVYLDEPPVMDTRIDTQTAEQTATGQAKRKRNSAARDLTWWDWTDIQPDGSFEFTSLPRGRMEFVSICDGAISQSPPDKRGAAMNRGRPCGRSQVFTSHDEAEKITLLMEPTVTFEAKVVNEDGKPVQNAWVYFSAVVEWGKSSLVGLGYETHMVDVLNSENRQIPLPRSIRSFGAMTDTKGIAIVTSLPPWADSCHISHEGYDLPERIDSDGSRRRDIAVNFMGGGRIKMTIPVQRKHKVPAITSASDTVRTNLVDLLPTEQKACISNLLSLVAAKKQAVLDDNLKNGAEVPRNKVAPYVEGGFDSLKCPSGGHYILGNAGIDLRCSFHGTLTQAMNNVRVIFTPDTNFTARSDAVWPSKASRIGQDPSNEAWYFSADAGIGKSFPVNDKDGTNIFNITVLQGDDSSLTLKVDTPYQSVTQQVPRDGSFKFDYKGTAFQINYPSIWTKPENSRPSARAKVLVVWPDPGNPEVSTNIPDSIIQNLTQIHLEFRLAEREPASGLTEALVEKSGKKIWLHAKTELSDADVASAKVLEDGDLELWLSAAGTEKFEKLTRENIGKLMAILVDGKVVSAPIIHAKIKGGRIEIAGQFTPEEAKRIAQSLSNAPATKAITQKSKRHEATPPSSVEKVQIENAKRKQIGLRTIDPAWSLDASNRVFKGAQVWIIATPNDPNRRTQVMKVVNRREDGTIANETDYYYSGRYFFLAAEGPDMDKRGIHDEFLYLKYDYASQTLSLQYVGKDVDIHTKRKELNSHPHAFADVEKTADTLLSSWGVRRL